MPGKKTFKDGTMPRTCLAPDCDRRTTARGLCSSHYKQGQKAADFSLPLRDPWPLQWNLQVGECTVTGCNRPKKSRGYCQAHYIRWSKGELQPDRPVELRGMEQPFRNGDGYMVVRVRSDSPLYPGQKVLEHRLVMSRHLGRELDPNETVHHKNSVRDDNRLENLELWVGNHSQGSRLEDRLEDAVSLIERYGLTDELKMRLHKVVG